MRQDASFIPAQGIPERFVIPPLRQVIFHGVAFRRGDHLQLNAIRAAVIPPGGNASLVSFPATAAWGIDYALRGTQGVDISEGTAAIDLTVQGIGAFLQKFTDACGGPIVALAATSIDWWAYVDNVAEFLQCTVTKAKGATTDFLTALTGSSTASRYVVIASGGLKAIVFAVQNIPLILELAYVTYTSPGYGCVRVDALPPDTRGPASCTFP